ncbi:unnamed protein product, partial [Phaeothamnion confervicola]
MVERLGEIAHSTGQDDGGAGGNGSGSISGNDGGGGGAGGRWLQWQLSRPGSARGSPSENDGPPADRRRPGSGGGGGEDELGHLLDDAALLDPSMGDAELEVLLEQLAIRVLAQLASTDSSLQEELNCPDDSGYSLLHYTCLYSLGTLVPVLLARGASVHQPSACGQRLTPLHCAAIGGDLALAQALLQAGAAAGAVDAAGATPAQHAFACGHHEMGWWLNGAAAGTLVPAAAAAGDVADPNAGPVLVAGTAAASPWGVMPPEAAFRFETAHDGGDGAVGSGPRSAATAMDLVGGETGRADASVARPSGQFDLPSQRDGSASVGGGAGTADAHGTQSELGQLSSLAAPRSVSASAAGLGCDETAGSYPGTAAPAQSGRSGIELLLRSPKEAAAKIGGGGAGGNNGGGCGLGVNCSVGMAPPTTTQMLQDVFANLSLHEKCALSLSLQKKEQQQDGGVGAEGGAAVARRDAMLEDVSSVLGVGDEGRLRAAMSMMAPAELNALEEEATVIQQGVRTWLLRRNYRSLRSAARTLQGAWRERQRGRGSGSGSLSAAAATLQAATRGMLARRNF